MKKNLLYICSLAGLMMFGSCSDELNTEPTDQVSGSQVFIDATSAESAINGIYRMLYVAGWSSSWGTENCGLTAINLLADLMGEDHLMYAQGQGWFYEDYRLNVHGDFSGKSGRSYALWNFFYTMISNANYIIAAEETMGGEPDAIKSIVGQAYAIRGFCYFNLIQLYQQTYINNQDAPGVPLYTEPTVAGSEGKPRGTVQGVYDQITSDLGKAETLLNGLTQKHISHIDYYIVKGMQARVAMVMHDYATAAAAATEALTKSGLQLATVAQLGNNNNTDVCDVMWGVNIIADQSQGFAGFFSH
ncbi:MAG: RagB/SusD family nutrient uptake outer membrane protein, partial [Parabacteroides sp.]|nr:RagB/SusD family nutrient uptake outer membrane protein [Parabacteroides sp.]